MGKRREATKENNGNGANLGFEAKLWLAADKMRNNMDAAEYKHVVLGLIFLKYISDSFEEMHQRYSPHRKMGPTPKMPMNSPRQEAYCRYRLSPIRIVTIA